MQRIERSRGTRAAGLGLIMLLAQVGLITGCTGLKYATKERPLFSAFAVELTSEPAVEKGEAQRELEAVVTPTPNNSILGMRPTVALHNMIKEPKKPKGLGHLLKNKIGTAPVYLDTVPLEDINTALINRMNNRGYFAATSSYQVMVSGKKAKVVFTVVPGRPHLLRSISVGDSTKSGVDSALAKVSRGTQVVSGEPYQLANLVEDRLHSVDRLRDRGWYRLRPEDLEWASDTSVGDHQVDLHLRVKSTTSNAKRMPYSIGSVTVHGDKDELLPPSDTSVVEGIHYVNYLGMYRPPTIVRGVFIRPGDAYSLRRTDATQRYLGSYGVFSNVLIAYADDSARQGVLNTSITLLPQKRFSLFSELNAKSKSNNFAGPGLKFGFRDRDLFRGAEQFTVDVNGSFEVQLGASEPGTYAYEVNAKAGLQVPRMLLLPTKHLARSSVPNTNFDMGIGVFRRIGLYGLRSASTGVGYTWRTDNRSYKDLKVLEVSLNNLYYTSPEFDAFLDENPTIRRSFEEEFIIGFGYTYSHSGKRRSGQRNWLTYSLGGDQAGFITSILFRGVQGSRPEEGYTLLGQRYSQYVRFRPELRWYQMVGASGAQVVFRLLTQAGYAYGNSTIVPYVKQFFTGGPNSLRGFRSRSVGPGSYVPSDDALQVDQVGDVNLETNVEYRFTLSGHLKGALFADAGNVWLLNDDPQRPGGLLEWNDIVSEIALDGGFGVRYDLDVVVVRLDLAAPLRRPDLPAGDRWVFNNLEEQWKRNLILNIGIGYPF